MRRDFDRDRVVQDLPLQYQLRYAMKDCQIRTAILTYSRQTDKETHTEVQDPLIISTRCVTSQKNEVLTYTAEECICRCVVLSQKNPSSLKIVAEKISFSTGLMLGKNVIGARNECVCKRMGWAVSTYGGEEKCE